MCSRISITGCYPSVPPSVRQDIPAQFEQKSIGNMKPCQENSETTTHLMFKICQSSSIHGMSASADEQRTALMQYVHSEPEETDKASDMPRKP